MLQCDKAARLMLPLARPKSIPVAIAAPSGCHWMSLTESTWPRSTCRHLLTCTSHNLQWLRQDMPGSGENNRGAGDGACCALSSTFVMSNAVHGWLFNSTVAMAVCCACVSRYNLAI